MSGGGAKNPSTRLLPPIKNPFFNPNEDPEEVRVTSVVWLSVSFYELFFFDLINKYVCVLQNSHPERPRPGRRLGGLANLFSSRHRNSGSPSSAREEIEGCREDANENLKILSPGSSRPVSKESQRPIKGPTITSEATKSDTGSGNVKTVNSRVPQSSRFARNLSNPSEPINDTNTNGDLPADNERGKLVSSSRQNSKPVITDKKRTALLHRGKEKRLLVKQDSVEGDRKIHSANSKHDRLHHATSSSDTEVVARRNSRSRREEKKPERIRYHDALSLR